MMHSFAQKSGYKSNYCTFEFIMLCYMKLQLSFMQFEIFFMGDHFTMVFFCKAVWLKCCGSRGVLEIYMFFMAGKSKVLVLRTLTSFMHRISSMVLLIKWDI